MGSRRVTRARGCSGAAGPGSGGGATWVDLVTLPKGTVLYRDETGDLAHAFNLMTGELEQAYGQIKSYALETAIARSREQKVRNIFQKYVPKEVLDQYLASPESMLKGKDIELAVLFSDIRDFTSITERLKPDELVDSLKEHGFMGALDGRLVGSRGARPAPLVAHA